MTDHVVPRVPASAGALIGDGHGHVLLLEPTYKPGWTIPGGQMEEDGETPWEACRREVREETGLVVDSGRLVCVDFVRPRPGREGGMRFTFACGDIDPDRRTITLQEDEIASYRWATPDEADELLRGSVRRRVAQGLAAGRRTRYLEDGRPVDRVTAGR